MDHERRFRPRSLTVVLLALLEANFAYSQEPARPTFVIEIPREKFARPEPPLPYVPRDPDRPPYVRMHDPPSEYGRAATRLMNPFAHTPARTDDTRHASEDGRWELNEDGIRWEKSF